MLKDGQKVCVICGFVFAPKQGSQICCNATCSAEREKQRQREKRRILTPHLAGIVRAEELTKTEELTEEDLAALPAPIEPLPPPAGYPAHWVINPAHGKTGEPLYAWDDGYGNLTRPNGEPVR